MKLDKKWIFFIILLAIVVFLLIFSSVIPQFTADGELPSTAKGKATGTLEKGQETVAGTVATIEETSSTR